MSTPFFSITEPKLHELDWSRDHLIFYLLRGTVQLRVNSRNYTLMAEDFLSIEPGSLYTFTHGQDMLLLQLTMPTALLRQFTGASYPDRRVIRCFSGDHTQSVSGMLSDVRRRLANLFDLQYSAAVPNELLFTGRALLLYDYLYANFSDHETESAAPNRNTGIYNYLCAACTYIREHACEGVKLTDAAAHIGVTPEYLSRSLSRYMNISFSDLIHQERIRIAQEMLRDTDKPITEIALITGYSSSSAFITAFKKKFGITPQHFRNQPAKSTPFEPYPDQETGSYDAIRKYIQHDSGEDIASGALSSVQRTITTDAESEGNLFYDGWNRVMSICSAGDILKSSIQNQILMAKRDFNFEYLYFHDVYNDDMMIYDEDTNGSPMFNFRNLDACLRFILSLGIKPYIELSFMPVKLARMDRGKMRFLNRMNVMPPADWDKWEMLVRATLEFCVRQYGIEQVSTWCFTSAMIYNVYLHELLTRDEYFELYLRTYRAVKAVCPGAVFLGPGADTTLICQDWEQFFQPFIDFCREHDCLPDMISLRLYPIDMSRFSRKDVTAMREDHSILKRSPNFFVSEDYLHESLKKTVRKLEAAGYHQDRISIDRWNGNVSQSDPSNDICYKSALIVKTVLENRDLAANLCYWTLSDQMAHLDFSFSETDLAGSVGLLTSEGLRKSAYYGMMLLSMLHGRVIDEGDGYILLKNDQGFLLMLYQYCHYDTDAVEHMIEKQMVADPYMMCKSGERQVYTITIENVPQKEYNAEYYSVGRKSGGNLYETWHRLGLPKVINAYQRSFLDGTSLPAYRFNTISAEGGNLHVSCVVEPHDVILIRFTPNDKSE